MKRSVAILLVLCGLVWALRQASVIPPLVSAFAASPTPASLSSTLASATPVPAISPCLLEVSVNGGPFTPGVPPNGSSYGLGVHVGDILQVEVAGCAATGILTLTGLAGAGTASLPFVAGTPSNPFQIEPANLAGTGNYWIITMSIAGYVSNSVVLTVQ